MDLQKWLIPPPVGEPETDAPRPLLEQSVRDVADESIQTDAQRGEWMQFVDYMLSLAQYARADFTEPPSDDYLDELVEPLVDAETLDEQLYVRFLNGYRTEFASAMLRSFVSVYSSATGVFYSLPTVPSGADHTPYVQRSLSRFGETIARTVEELGSQALQFAVNDFINSAFRAMRQAWDELVSWRDPSLPTDPVELDLELRLRELEANLQSYCNEAMRRAEGLGELSPQEASELLDVVDSLIQLLERVLNVLDVTLALAALRIRVDFKRWTTILKHQIEGMARREASNLLYWLGGELLRPVMRLVYRISGKIEALEKLTGNIPQLDYIEHALDEVREWERRFRNYLVTLGQYTRRSGESAFQSAAAVKRYDKLRRRRRLCVVMMRLLHCVREGLERGRSMAGRWV